MKSIDTFKYLGCDVNLNFIEFARKKYNNNNTCDFIHNQDEFPANLEENSYDYLENYFLYL